MRRLLAIAARATLSLLLTYLVCEAAYRAYTYNGLLRGRFSFMAVESPLYVHDPHVGYRYRPARYRLTRFDAEDNVLRSNSFSVNNLGHVSRRDDALEKPPGEFRIAVLGDSYTACLDNEVPWPDLLEDTLNGDAALKRSLGVRAFKVMNFAMDGTGIVQFARVYEIEAARFAPDLVVVNFTDEVIRQKFIWRTTVSVDATGGDSYATLACSSPAARPESPECIAARIVVLGPSAGRDKTRISEVKRAIARTEAARLPWWSPSPELLARGLRHIGIAAPTRLSLGAQLDQFYDEAEGLRASTQALLAIAARHERVLFLHDPLDGNVARVMARTVTPRVRALMAADRRLTIVSMVDRLPDAGEDEVRRWFNFPYDGHFSDHGAGVYARAVARVIRERLTPSSASRSGIPCSSSSASACRAGAPSPRPG